MNNFIGIGEEWALDIFNDITDLEQFNDLESWGRPGIYSQVPMKNLIKLSFFQNLSREHRRSSADIVLITRDHNLIVVRVQGKGHGEGWFKGQGKVQFDSVQEFWLKESGCIVVNLARWNCPMLLNEKDRKEARNEILRMFESAGLNDLVCYAN